MESILQYLELIVTYGMPLLPYAGIAMVVHQLMSGIIQPAIKGHRTVKGAYDKKIWFYARWGMKVYPMLLGALFALPWGLSVGYGIMAGASAQMWYLLVKSIAKKKFNIDLDRDNLSRSMMINPGDNPAAVAEVIDIAEPSEESAEAVTEEE
jgi:hypothetical protein